MSARPAKQPPAGSGLRFSRTRDGDRVRLITHNGFKLACRMGNVLVFAVVGALFALTPLATFASRLPGRLGP